MSNPIDERLRRITTRFGRPTRPRRAEAAALVAAVTDPREAWETAASRGLIPPEWVDDPRRGFVVQPIDAPSRALCERSGAPAIRVPSSAVMHQWSYPPTLAAVANFAADADGVQRAESLAREWRGRIAALRNERMRVPDRVLWIVGPGARAMRRDPGAVETGLWSALSVTVGGLGLRPAAQQAVHPRRRPGDPMLGLVERETILAVFDVAAVVARGGRVPVTASRPIAHWIGREWAAVPNPFEPVADLLETGYGLRGVSGQHGVFLIGFDPDDPP